jgi:hypothetical protein
MAIAGLLARVGDALKLGLAPRRVVEGWNPGVDQGFGRHRPDLSTSDMHVTKD